MNKKVIFADERTNQHIGKVCVWTVLVTYVYLIVELVYKVLIKNQVEDCGWPIVLLLLISVILAVGNRKNVNAQLPRSFTGKALPLDPHGKDKRVRLFYYAIDSIIFALIMTVVYYLEEYFRNNPSANLAKFIQNFLPSMIAEVIVVFLLSFLLEYLYREHVVKKYNASLKDDDEE